MTSVMGGGGQSPLISSIINQYGAFASIFQGIPEVSDLMVQASQENWTSDKFNAALMNTNWWKSSSESERQWQIRKLTDPASAAQDVNTMGTRLQALQIQTGVHLSSDQVKWLTEAAIGQGWNDQQLSYWVMQNATNMNTGSGAIGAAQDAIHKTAAEYGITLSPQTAFQWGRHIAQGITDQNAFNDYAKGQAKVHYSYWSKQLDDGMTVRQLADPYIQQAAKMLEISPDQIDLTDPKWAAALHGNQDPTGKGAPMSMLDWQRTLMTNPTYGYDRTDQARQAAMDMTKTLEQSFGAQK